MVRVISTSSIGLGDYGGSIQDHEVDGVAYPRDFYPTQSTQGVSSSTPKVKPITFGKIVSKNTAD